MEKRKCITFDAEAKNSIPQNILDKMKSDKEKAREDVLNSFKEASRSSYLFSICKTRAHVGFDAIVKSWNRPKIKLVCIIGDSGVGKTLAANYYVNSHNSSHLITSYTTRPIRNGEVEGIDHYFVTKDKIPEYDLMLAYTVYGEYEYWTTIGQLWVGKENVYVINEDGLSQLMHKPIFQLIDLRAILIEREIKINDNERTDRDKDRTRYPKWFYDYVINNNKPKEDLFTKISNLTVY